MALAHQTKHFRDQAFSRTGGREPEAVPEARAMIIVTRVGVYGHLLVTKSDQNNTGRDVVQNQISLNR